jgi:hypothetical protein
LQNLTVVQLHPQKQILRSTDEQQLSSCVLQTHKPDKDKAVASASIICGTKSEPTHAVNIGSITATHFEPTQACLQLADWVQGLHHLQFWQQLLPRHAPGLHPLLLSALLMWCRLRQQQLVCWQQCQQQHSVSLHQVVLLLLVLLRWQQYQQLRPVSLHQVLLLPLLCWQ